MSIERCPIYFEIVHNRVIVESLVCKNKKLRQFIQKNLTIDENANRIGEFALGTNIYLKKLIGNLTQDEKFPSVHIAWGDPHGSMTGAQWSSIQHQDAVILNTTVGVDQTIIMKEGKYLI